MTSLENNPKALIVWGGWDGHEPEQVANVFNNELAARGFDVEVADTLDAFKDAEKLLQLKLIIPVWTMGEINAEQLDPILEAVKSGVGLGGIHGGMCDAFRTATEWQFLTGGQWVSHPGNDGVKYEVDITNADHFITAGSPSSFPVVSEQYYMHVDPAVKVLAKTTFPVADGPHVPNGKVDIPVVWTKYYGNGRVFFSSLGHVASVVNQPEILRLTIRGLLWAALEEDRAES